MNDNEWTCGSCDDWRSVKGLTWRMAFSAVTALTWFGFIIAWLFFLADEFSILQNIGILILSVVVLATMNAPVWITFANVIEDVPRTTHGNKVRPWAGGVLALAWAVGVGLWLLLYAGDYSLYQNLAVLILSVVPIGAISMLLKL